jgi:hypothetical protein
LSTSRPAHEVRDRARRPVAVEHLEAETLRREIGLYAHQRLRRRPRQQAARGLVAVDARADEIIVAEVAHVDDQPRDHAGGVDKARGHLLRRRGLLRRRRHLRLRRNCEEEHERERGAQHAPDGNRHAHG